MWFRPFHIGLDRRVIIYFYNGYFEFSVLEPTYGLFNWNSVKSLQQILPFAIGYIWVNPNGEIELLEDDRINLPEKVRNHAFSLMLQVSFDNTPELWNLVPENLLEQLIANMRDASLDVQQEWGVRNEDALTGSLFRNRRKFQVKDWQLEFGSVEFSGRSKESVAGADAAVLMRVTDSENRTSIKTLWFQAKRTNNPFNPLSEYRDLSRQLSKMRSFNKDSFALLYSPQGVLVALDDENSDQASFANFLKDSLRCKHGNTDPNVFINSVDRKNTFGIEIRQIK